MATTSAAARLRELRNDESATRVLSRAQHTVDRSAVMLLYGQRLALLGEVSAAMHAIVVEEEKGRRDIRNQWDYSVWMGEVVEDGGRTVAAVALGASVDEAERMASVSRSSRLGSSHSTRLDVGGLGHPSSPSSRPPSSSGVLGSSRRRDVRPRSGGGASAAAGQLPPTAPTGSGAAPSLRDMVQRSNSRTATPAAGVLVVPPATSTSTTTTAYHTDDEPLVTRRRFKLSSAAMRIATDPNTSEKIVQAQRERALEKLLQQTRPAADAVPRLHFIPPVRLSVNTLDKGFTPPILGAMYGPTSAHDAAAEGRPMATVPWFAAKMAASEKKGRRHGGGGAMVTVVPTGGGGGGGFHHADSMARAGGNNNRSIAHLQYASGILTSSNQLGGLSAALSRTFSPLPQNRKGGGGGGGPLSAQNSLNNNPLLHRNRSQHRYGSSDTIDNLTDGLELTIQDEGDGAPLGGVNGGGANASATSTTNTSPTTRSAPIGSLTSSGGRMIGGGGFLGTASSDGRDSNTNLTLSIIPKESTAHTRAGWYTAEQDTARAVAVMACLVADGFDEAAVRERFVWDGANTTATTANSGMKASASPADNGTREGEDENPLAVLTAEDVDAITTAIINHQPPPPAVAGMLSTNSFLDASRAQESLAERQGILSNPTRVLTADDIAMIEEAVMAAKRSKDVGIGGGSTADTNQQQQQDPSAIAQLRADWLKKAARAFRAAVNKITTDEHEDRYEVVHEEITAYKYILQKHRTELQTVRTTTLTGQQHSRMVLERRCTLELLKIVLLWQHQHDQMMELYWGRRAILHRVASGRRALEANETAARKTIEEYGLVLARRITKDIAAEEARLQPIQAAYTRRCEEDELKRIAARQAEQQRLEREQLLREHQEVERLMKQKEHVRQKREDQWRQVAHKSPI